jgi:hypothetical protein
MEVHALRVECRTSGGDWLPVRFGRGDSVQDVAEVLDRWPGGDYCYFRVRTLDGAFYILRHDERDDSWLISVFSVGDPLPPQETPPLAGLARRVRGDFH